MRPEDTPWLDAHSLRKQIDEVLPAVIERAKSDPDHQFSGRVQGKLLRILAVILEQYSSRLILDTDIWEWLWERAPKKLPVVDLASPPEPITAEEMWIVLGSVRASLMALEELEAQGATYGSTAAARRCGSGVLSRNLSTLPPVNPGIGMGIQATGNTGSAPAASTAALVRIGPASCRGDDGFGPIASSWEPGGN